MESPAPKYTQLKGSGRKSSGFVSLVGTTYSLMLGDDHLLQVESDRGFSEQYRRFYFRDIQAIILRKNSRFLVGNIILGASLGLLLAIAAAFLPSSFANGASSWNRLLNEPAEFIGVMLLGSFAVLIVILWLVHLLRGGTCICHIQTAVQTEELPSLYRIARARRVLEQLRPLILQAQTQAPQESSGAGMPESGTVPPPNGETTA